MIKFHNLSKSYDKGKVQAVKGLNLQVESGELFGFLGPNGAGKTTTIKMMVGLLQPDQGQVLLEGVNTREQPLQAKRLLGYVPDEPLLYEKMSGLRFLKFVADVYEVPEDQRDYALQLAELFELKEALGNPASSYSHGMRQKLAIIAALVHKPRILILDEPIVGLDPKATFNLKQLMRSLCDAGHTVFFSTHIMEVAERLCDRVGIIHQSELIAAAPFAELRKRAGSQNDTLENLFLELTDAPGTAG